MKENVDGISKLWVPDKKLCTDAEELRQEMEWLRKKNGLDGQRPSQLGIENYRYGDQLHPKFFEGQKPPRVALDSVENIEWYQEQLKRCVYGFEYMGQRITGDHYWFLNFFPFLVAKKDKRGRVTKEFDIAFPYYSTMHDYIFKVIEEAHFYGKGVAWMAGRGVGKTYIVLSILSKIYHLKPKSHCIVSASHSGHANEAFSKMLLAVDSIAEAHPTLSLNRLIDTKNLIESGQEVVRDGIKYKEGPRSRIQKVIYGDNAGATRGGRPDAQLMEEMGDWSTGKGDLKSCIGASKGSWRVGAINKCRVFMIGTGGSVSSDQARDVFTNPDAYELLPLSDFNKPKKHCIFLPATYLMGGMGWEETAVNNNERSLEFLKEERERTKDDMEIHNKLIQEYPFTIDEVFRKMGSNTFNQRKIAEQWTKLQYEWKDNGPEKGFLEWVRNTPGGKISGVKWASNPEGNIEIVEHPYKGENGTTTYPDLYVGGVDSIDQGVLDSTSLKGRSSLACLIKKRIVDGQHFNQTSNVYVAKYIGRQDDVRWDYEEVLKLSMYYDAKMNIEYTKIGIVGYFRDKGQFHKLLKRPLVAMPSGGDGMLKRYGVEQQRNLIGTTVSTNVIDHQDGKIKEYIEDHSSQVMFVDLLEQLRDYQREDRTKYDLVIAMGLCELADEDMLGIPSREYGSETRDFRPFGYYTDERGQKRFGEIPAAQSNIFAETSAAKGADAARWIDMSGQVRFDTEYNITDASELEENKPDGELHG